MTFMMEMTVFVFVAGKYICDGDTDSKYKYSAHPPLSGGGEC